MRIVSNETNIYKCLKQKNKYISEFIVYLMYGDTPVEAYIEYGNTAKNERINNLKLMYNIQHNITNNYIII